MYDWFLPQFYIQLVFKATLSFTLIIQIVSDSLLRNWKFILKAKIYILLTFVLSNATMLKVLIMKSCKKRPQKYLRKTEIDFFFLLPWACSKMWLIDQLYIKLGFLHREYQFSIFIRQIHFFVSKLLILRRWNERFLEFHQFHSGDLYSHLIFSAMIKMK